MKRLDFIKTTIFTLLPGYSLLADHDTNKSRKKVVTANDTPSQFQEIHDFVELTITTYSSYPNNAFKRKMVINDIDVFLRENWKRFNIQDYFIKCDEVNNPPSYVKEGRFHCDVYVKMPYQAQFYKFSYQTYP